tara:strand:- start:541 stop:759 length:219 start_codon:yes stop_codon:yes gene_type:complete
MLKFVKEFIVSAENYVSTYDKKHEYDITTESMINNFVNNIHCLICGDKLPDNSSVCPNKKLHRLILDEVRPI